jgi:hypothetical protein
VKRYEPQYSRHQGGKMFLFKLWTLQILIGILVCLVSADEQPFAIQNGVELETFDHPATGASLKFVKNSGICETTPDVNSYSGYITVGKNMSMWFWFFESRKDPAKAPLALWLNGGTIPHISIATS